MYIRFLDNFSNASATSVAVNSSLLTLDPGGGGGKTNCLGPSGMDGGGCKWVLVKGGTGGVTTSSPPRRSLPPSATVLFDRDLDKRIEVSVLDCLLLDDEDDDDDDCDRGFFECPAFVSLDVLFFFRRVGETPGAGERRGVVFCDDTAFPFFPCPFPFHFVDVCF